MVDKMRFPQLVASNLEGRKYRLPYDLEGALNILILAFQREQQGLVDEWIMFLESFSNEFDFVNYNEIPTIHFSYSLFRWMIDGGMRSGIADKVARERTITVYVDKEEFRRQLEITSEASVTILLLRKDGEILWRTTGRYGEDKALELRHFVERISFSGRSESH
jgi:hypothetical protein